MNLNSDDVRNCKQELSFKKSKKVDKFRESKTLKSARTVSKTRSGNQF